MALKIFLAAAILTVLVFITAEIRTWCDGTKVLTKRHKTIRVISAVVVTVILAMLLFVDNIQTYGIKAVLIYWMIFAFLMLAMIALVFTDMRHVANSWGKERKELTGQLCKKDEKDSECK